MDRVDREGPGFLREPTRESWTYLTNRFKLLERGTEKIVQNILVKMNVGKDEISNLSKRHQSIVRYLIAEQATLACLAETTQKKIEQLDVMNSIMSVCSELGIQ